jgi:hypothetical protein
VVARLKGAICPGRSSIRAKIPEPTDALTLMW